MAAAYDQPRNKMLHVRKYVSSTLLKCMTKPAVGKIISSKHFHCIKDVQMQPQSYIHVHNIQHIKKFYTIFKVIFIIYYYNKCACPTTIHQILP
jgi:hypothetical protein